MNFKGHEELKDMNKKELINLWKDTVNPNRSRGDFRITKTIQPVMRKGLDGVWFEYDLIQSHGKEIRGTDMSEFRPRVGEDEYTWNQIENYPADMIRIFLYNILSDGMEEE